MIRNILVPLDGSPTSESVLPYVEVLQRCLDSNILLWQAVHAADPGQGAAAYRYLSNVGARFPEEKHRSRVASEPAAGGIVRAARDEEADLIAMCTRGKTGLSRFFQGSVTRAVLQASPGPVLVVPPAMRWAGPSKFRRIVVALDPVEDFDGVISVAAEIARAYGAQLVLLATTLDGIPSEAALSRLLEHRRRLIERDVDTDAVLRHGNPVEEILDYAAANEADLVALSRPFDMGGNGIGNVAESLLAEATFPLLVQQVRSPHAAAR